MYIYIYAYIHTHITVYRPRDVRKRSVSGGDLVLTIFIQQVLFSILSYLIIDEKKSFEYNRM